jgi:hypothetical protein
MSGSLYAEQSLRSYWTTLSGDSDMAPAPLSASGMRQNVYVRTTNATATVKTVSNESTIAYELRTE